MEDVVFPLVVLDEGSQCCEPEALIALTKGESPIGRGGGDSSD